MKADMHNLSIKRLVILSVATGVVAMAPHMQAAFAAPIPAGAGFEELAKRFEAGLISGTSGLVSALVGMVLAYFTRADKTEPVFALAKKDAE